MTHEEILSMLGDYVDYLIANSSAEAPMWNIEKVRSGKPNKWNYIDGCMITACLSLYKTTGDEKYLEFSKEFIDYFVQPDGSIKTYDPKEYNLDNVNQGKNLFILYDIYGDEKYRKAIDTIRSQLFTQPRTKEGNFWHKGHLSVAGVAGRHLYGTALLHGVRDPLQQDAGLHRQLQAVHEHQKAHAGRKDRPVLPRLRREPPDVLGRPRDRLQPQLLAARHGLVPCGNGGCAGAHGRAAVQQRVSRHHGHAQTGCGGHAQVPGRADRDVLAGHRPPRRPRATIWRPAAPPCLPTQYSRACVWAICPKRMAAWAEKAFYGTCDRYLSKNPDGSLQLDGICLVAGLGGKDHRDGSLAYYFSEPVVCNDAKGVGPLVLAYTEMIAKK